MPAYPASTSFGAHSAVFLCPYQQEVIIPDHQGISCWHQTVSPGAWATPAACSRFKHAVRGMLVLQGWELAGGLREEPESETWAAASERVHQQYSYQCQLCGESLR